MLQFVTYNGYCGVYFRLYFDPNPSGERTTCNVKIRILSLLLLLVLTLLLLMPLATVDAADETDPAVIQLQQQIRNTYAEARRRSGFYSFNGWCGSLVNWQTYLLGIDSAVHGCDGKNEYDMYARLDTTCGGYKVKSYPVSQYTISYGNG